MRTFKLLYRRNHYYIAIIISPKSYKKIQEINFKDFKLFDEWIIFNLFLCK